MTSVWRVWRVVIAVGLAVLVFLGAYLAGGKEGPCWTETEFGRSFEPNSVDLQVQDRSFPPGRGCRAVAPDGREVGSVMYPRPFEWLLVLAALLLPFVVTALWRASRRVGLRPARSSRG